MGTFVANQPNQIRSSDCYAIVRADATNGLEIYTGHFSILLVFKLHIVGKEQTDVAIRIESTL